ncbi:acyl-CoA reductase [Roseovarius sp.]|jgi:acyl-CoA reductase-like NAD-dependent aldehyde dehydrogenase
MVERACYLPGLDPEALHWKTLTFGQGGGPLYEVAVPVLEPQDMTRLAAHVRHHAAQHLRPMPVSRIVEVIDRVIARLLDRQDPYRQRMERALPVVTGYDAEMVRVGLTRYLKTFRKPELLRFLAEDFPNPAILDEFQPLPKGGYGRAFGPGVLGHIWAGNVPALPLWSLVCGLLVKSGTIGKVSSAEPLFATWFAEVLAEVAPELSDCLAVVWWQGGEDAPERALLQSADMALAYGSANALADIQSRMPSGKRLLQFGHKVSFAMIAAEALDPAKAADTARRAAEDIARYDQQGCFAPHVVFVEKGGHVSPRVFARYLAGALSAFGQRYPRRALSMAEANSLAAWRQQEEFAHGAELIGDALGDWSVSFHEGGQGFGPSCLNRAIRVVAVDGLTDVPGQVAPYWAVLQTVGIAAPPDALFRLAGLLGEAGVTRIAALGDMTTPEAGWHHDGRFNLSDLVQITEMDARAPPAADGLASYDD